LESDGTGDTTKEISGRETGGVSGKKFLHELPWERGIRGDLEQLEPG